DYLESTSEKDFFSDTFINKVKGKKISSLLDLGCFDGTLTRKLIANLEKSNQSLSILTVVEPAAAPLKEFEQQMISVNALKNNDLQFINSSMEDFLLKNMTTYDWVIVSHSLYWVGDNSQVIKKIINTAKNGAIIIRDTGVLHEVEMKYRPLMTSKHKRFISSNEICDVFNEACVKYEIQNFKASMRVSNSNSPEFKQLAGFLLDLKLDEINDSLLENLYNDLNVKNDRSTYGIDIIWFGEIIK
ncbi:MAG: class I SAM-dependent methyltransferase, partial [Bdellovibrionales bacterium]